MINGNFFIKTMDEYIPHIGSHLKSGDTQTAIDYLGRYLRRLDRDNQTALGDLGRYLYGLDETYKRELRRHINSGSNGPGTAVIRVLLDNQYPNYESLREQVHAYNTSEISNDIIYKGRVIGNPERRVKVIGYLMGKIEPDDNIETIVRMALADEEDIKSVIKVLGEYGYGEQEARRLLAKARKELLYQ